MNMLYGFLLGILASLIAGCILTPIRQGFAEVWHMLRTAVDPDGVNLSGTWKATFKEPTGEGEEKERTEEVITFKQTGRRIRGTSKIGDPMKRQFRYEGTLNHRVVSATYRRIDAERGSISGSGVLFVKVSDDRTRMNGVCVWLDKDTRGIEVSVYDLRLEG